MAKQTKSTTGKSTIMVVLMLCLAGSIQALDESGTNEKSEQTEQRKEESAAFLAAKLRAEERAKKTESEASWPYKSPPVERRRGESDAGYQARLRAEERANKIKRDGSETYNLDVKTIVSEETIIVKQIIITTTCESPLEFSAGGSLHRSYLKPISGSGNGQASTTLTILVSIRPKRIGNSTTELFKFKSATRAGGGFGHTNSSARLYDKIEDLILLTAKSGDYKLGEALSLGTFKGKPIVLLMK